jgi:hypothetical protein
MTSGSTSTASDLSFPIWRRIPRRSKTLPHQRPIACASSSLQLDAMLDERQALFRLEKGSAQPLPGPRDWWERECAKLIR